VASLRDRLKLIKESKKNGIEQNTISKPGDAPVLKGWEPCGYFVQKRIINTPFQFKITNNLPNTLPVLIPDLSGSELPLKEEFLFFDLETTGLHGGSAGTIAFLAAFGKFVSGKLSITQYLLIDYPGINDFLENILKEFKNEKSVIVTYNGKCFDSQIIKSMCLINRIKPPVYKHADLLHPARRLWKSIIKDCSQSSIEANVLKIERKNDIPGSLAPEIWFDFLKTGNTEKLIGICDHNVYDIKGLAAILAAIISIAKDPFNIKEYSYDTQRLAISVYKHAYRQMLIGNYKEPLELVTKAIEAIPKESLMFIKLMRRKLRLEKLNK